MNARQLNFIILHAIVLSNLRGYEVSIDDAGQDWSKKLAITYRINNP
jgi:hypothetical protein